MLSLVLATTLLFVIVSVVISVVSVCFSFLFCFEDFLHVFVSCLCRCCLVNLSLQAYLNLHAPLFLCQFVFPCSPDCHLKSLHPSVLWTLLMFWLGFLEDLLTLCWTFPRQQPVSLYWGKWWHFSYIIIFFSKLNSSPCLNQWNT